MAWVSCRSTVSVYGQLLPSVFQDIIGYLVFIYIRLIELTRIVKACLYQYYLVFTKCLCFVKNQMQSCLCMLKCTMHKLQQIRIVNNRLHKLQSTICKFCLLSTCSSKMVHFEYVRFLSLDQARFVSQQTHMFAWCWLLSSTLWFTLLTLRVKQKLLCQVCWKANCILSSFSDTLAPNTEKICTSACHKANLTTVPPSVGKKGPTMMAHHFSRLPHAKGDV